MEVPVQLMNLRAHFSELADPAGPRGLRHEQVDILLIILLRADRGAVREEDIRSRDEADRTRQRLTAPDITAIPLDGTLESSFLLRKASLAVLARLPEGLP